MADDSQRTRSSQEMSRATPGDAIHQEFLLSTVEHDEELLRDLVATFNLTYPKLLGELRESIAAAAPKEIRALVHQLEGMMATLGATKAAEILGKMGTAARNNNLELLPQFLEDVSGELALAKDSLDSILAHLQTNS